MNGPNAPSISRSSSLGKIGKISFTEQHPVQNSAKAYVKEKSIVIVIVFVDISMRIDSLSQSTNIFEVSKTSRFHSTAQARKIAQLQSQNKFCNRLTFLNKDRQFSDELNEIFRGNSIRFSDCRVSSFFLRPYS